MVAEKNVEGFVCLGLYVYENNLSGKCKCLSNVNSYPISSASK